MTETKVNTETICPNCGSKVSALTRIEPGLKLRLVQESGRNIPDEVCLVCLQQLAGYASAQSAIRAEQEAKEKTRELLWKNRIETVREARDLLNRGLPAEAAVAYEKYIKILEIAFGIDPGELTPAHFVLPQHRPEISVLTGVYWDLLRIYDGTNRYGDQQDKAAMKLAEFSRFSTMNAKIVKNAKKLKKSANNPEAFKLFLRTSEVKTGACFIATAACGNYRHPIVFELILFREKCLRPYVWGRAIISLYQILSPPIADIIRENKILRTMVKRLLFKIAYSNWLQRSLRK